MAIVAPLLSHKVGVRNSHMNVNWRKLSLGCSLVGLFGSGIAYVSPPGNSVWGFIVSGCLALPAIVLGRGRTRAVGGVLLVAGVIIGFLDFQAGRRFNERSRWSRELRQAAENQPEVANHTSDGIRQPADGSPKPSR